MDRADESSRIQSLEAQLRAEAKKLSLVQEIGQALSSALDLDRLLALIMNKITLLMEADRSTLYLVSDDGTELWSKVAQGDEVLEIRLQVGEGIAGWVARSGETVNIPDAYADQRFYPAVDLRSGYRTRSILCMPMLSTQGAIVGVVQVLNKGDGPFTVDDEALLAALASQAAVTIENSRLYHSVVAKNVELLEAQEQLQEKARELNILYAVEKEVTAAHDLGELLDRLLRRAMEVVSARAGSILLREPSSDVLTFRSTAGSKGEALRPLRIKMADGIVGWVAAQKQPLIVNDPAQDPRHDRRLAESIGFYPQSLICVPLLGTEDEECLGVVELLDKEDARGFDEEDLKLLALIAGQASRAIEIARAKEERVDQSRLASIGQMIAGVLHDLKTPMTIVSGYAQLMAQCDEADQRGRYVEQIIKQFEHMSAMTREVLAFARGQVNVLVRKVFLNKFLADVERQLAHEFAGRDIALILEPAYRGAAYLDEQKMMRVVHNVARNAAQAMPNGGTFRITTQVEDGQLVIEFADTGGGIPVELEGRLFQPFATSGKHDGSGLGLAIVKKIVEEHRGSIGYAPRGATGAAGTTFTVRIPLDRPANAVVETGAEVEAEL